MENNLPTQPEVQPVIPSPPTPSPTKPTALLIFLIVFVVISAASIGYLVWQNQQLMMMVSQNQVNQKQDISLNQEPTAEVADPTNSWKIQTAAALGIEYKVPSKLIGAETIEKGDTGTQYCMIYSGEFTFTIIKQVHAGAGCSSGKLALIADSKNYVAGREGGFWDYTGYESKNGKYSARFLDTVSQEFLPSKLVKEMTNKNGVTYLRVTGEDGNYPMGDETITRPILGTPGKSRVGALFNLNNSVYAGFNISMEINSADDVIIFDQILSTFKFTNQNQINPSPTPVAVNKYIPPTTWIKSTANGLTLCLPPKWERQVNQIFFNRDTGYRPEFSDITEIPYTGGAKREAYFKFWESEYPNVRNLVNIIDTDVNGNPVLTIQPVNQVETKESPEGLALVWYASGKLWKTGLSSWNMVNNSQTAFLSDYYTMISCSF
jgi:hypothetical protein